MGGQSLRRGQKGGQNGSMGPTKNRKANSASGAVVHMVPAMGQNGSQWLKMAQNRPKMAHGRVRERPKPSTLSKRGSKWLPTKNRKANSASGAVVHMVPAKAQNGSQWPTVGSKWLKMAHGGVKMGQYWPKMVHPFGERVAKRLFSGGL